MTLRDHVNNYILIASNPFQNSLYRIRMCRFAQNIRVYYYQVKTTKLLTFIT